MTEEYNIGTIHSIEKLEIEGKDRWNMRIDTGKDIKDSQHEGFYIKQFRIGEPIIYSYCVEFKNINKVFKEDYFVYVKDTIEFKEEEPLKLPQIKSKIGKFINGHVVGGNHNRHLKKKLARAEALVRELKKKIGIT